jgi:hypothetical protein
MSTPNTNWALIADIANVGKKRLRVVEQDSRTGQLFLNNNSQSSVDAQALEQIMSSCSASAVKEVEQILAFLDSGNSNNSDPLAKVLLRYAVLADAFKREQQANEILTNALESALAGVEAARNELNEARAERDALRMALSGK